MNEQQLSSCTNRLPQCDSNWTSLLFTRDQYTTRHVHDESNRWMRHKKCKYPLHTDIELSLGMAVRIYETGSGG